jgi:hypothetical protein
MRKPVPGFEGWTADDDGCVYSHTGREVGFGDDRVFVTTPWGLMARAVLVCLAFHGEKPFDGAMVLHKNDYPWDDKPDNLYWGDHLDNAEDAKRNGCYRVRPYPEVS